MQPKHRIRKQVEKSPDAVAVVFDGRHLTYAELNSQANRLAHHLRDLGVRPDDRVAICVERSLQMVVGLLATLKAGGAYVPLDPGYPVERLAYMLRDSAPSAILGHAATRELLQGLAGQQLVAPSELVQVVLLQLFEVQQRVVRAPRGADQFIDLDLQGFGIAVLRVLDQEHHEKGDDGGAGVDH